AVLGEHPAQRGRRRLEERGEDGQRQDAQRGQPADGPPVLAPREQAGNEDDEQQHAEPQLERERRQRAHGFTRRDSSGTVAVSTGPSAMPGAMPNSTMTAVRSTSATHSGPRASSRWWKCGDGGPQKICLVTRSTYTAVRNVPAMAGISHHGWGERKAPMKVRISATNPEVAGRP